MTASASPFGQTEPPLYPARPPHNWSWFAVRGGLMIVLGVMTFFFPAAALFAFALVFAAYCFFDGILAFVNGISRTRKGKPHGIGFMIWGLLGIAVGVLFVLFPELGTVAYAALALSLIAFWALATGLFELAIAWRMRDETAGEVLFILSGALSMLLGVGLVAMLWIAPAATLISVAWFIGLWALVAGVSMLLLAFRLRRHGRMVLQVR